MKYLILLITIFTLISCNRNLNSQSFENIQITVKSIVLNEALSQMNFCDDSGKNTLNNCYYKIDNQRYLKKETYAFDDYMNPIAFYHYLPEGPDIHSVEQMKVDTLYAKMVNFFNQKVIIDETNQFIIDGIDTIRNYKISHDENLILIERNEYINQPLLEDRLVILGFKSK